MDETNNRVNDILQFIYHECIDDKERGELYDYMRERWGEDWHHDLIWGEHGGSQGDIYRDWKDRVIDLKARREMDIPTLWKDRAPTGMQELMAWYDDWPYPLTEMLKWSARTQRKPQPELAIHSTLAVTSALASRRYKTTCDVPSSGYFISLCLSGEGKQHGLTMIRRVLRETENIHREMGEPASGTGLYDELRRNAAVISIMDEIADFIAAADGGRNASKASAIKQIKALYAAHESHYKTDAYSKRGRTADEVREMYKQELIWNPELSIYGCTTPQGWETIMDSRLINSGFLNRFLVIQSTMPRHIGLDPEPKPLPKSYLHFAQGLYDRWRAETGCFRDDADGSASIIRLRFSESAKSVFRALRERVLAHQIEADNEGLGALLSRTVEKALRLSLNIQLLYDPDSEVIDTLAARWAMQYALYCDLQQLSLYGRKSVDTPYEDMRGRFLEQIRKRGAQGLSQREASQKKPFRTVPAKDRYAILHDLEQSGLVLKTSTTSTLGRTTVTYFACDDSNRPTE